MRRIALPRWSRPVVRPVILAWIFLLALLPRAIHPVSMPMHWYSRAVRFGDAVLARDWANTFQRYHPGVTTMWLSGIGLKLFATARGLTSEQLLDIAPVQPGVIAQAVTAGVLPLALVIALGIALSYVLLGRLVDRRVAFVAACLLALDPFYIAYSQVLHVDALLATFMFVSVLFLLNYLHRGRRSDLVLSGVFGGLAFLTKSPSLFLVPYAGLAVGGYRLVAPRSGLAGHAGHCRWTGWLWEVAWTVAVWALAAAAVFVALWPAMWVQPLDVLYRMGQRIVFHLGTRHYNPVFFNGQVGFVDPGPLFYLATIGWKTTLVTLPMMCVGLASMVQQLRRGKRDVVAWLLAAYAVFFTAQMCLGARKELAYLLPAFPVLDGVAAHGVVWTAEAVAQARWWRGGRWLRLAVISGGLALQAALVLPRHPYYGTLHNRLLGGSRVAQHVLPLQDQGEGLDLAGQYLNTLPRAQRASAGVHARGSLVLKRYFVGLTSIVYDPRADYRVYYVNQIMRQLDVEDWGVSWEADRQTDPLWTVAFDGVPYVWVYGAPPQEPAAGGPEYEVHDQLGEHIQLRRVRLSAETLAPGDALTVVLVWESDGEVQGNYKVFCHVLSASGELVAQRDGLPLCGVRPTPGWRAGELIEDSYEILLDRDLAPGEYELSVGMYDAETMERLPARDAAGKRLPDDRVVVGMLRVE